jgi:GAF domain-containing protein
LRIPLGKGVCGQAAESRQSLIVPDVTRFEGHIVCDARSRSEIVVPMIHKGRLIGVLDVDSEDLDRFDKQDQAGLELFVAELVNRTEWPKEFQL